MLSWEKPLVKPMAPGSIFYYISFQFTFICIFTFPIYIIKYQKYIYLIIISIRSHFRKCPWRDWQPLYCVGCEFFVCLCRCVGLLRNLLLDWYLGSKKPREILTHAQEVARRISGAVAGEVFAQVKTYQVPITNPSPSHLHYSPFASRFPLPHFTLAVLFALSFPISSSFSTCLFLFACVLDYLLPWRKIIRNCVISRI